MGVNATTPVGAKCDPRGTAARQRSECAAMNILRLDVRCVRAHVPRSSRISARRHVTPNTRGDNAGWVPREWVVGDVCEHPRVGLLTAASLSHAVGDATTGNGARDEPVIQAARGGGPLILDHAHAPGAAIGGPTMLVVRRATLTAAVLTAVVAGCGDPDRAQIPCRGARSWLR